jgi:hypothetical protein
MTKPVSTFLSVHGTAEDLHDLRVLHLVRQIQWGEAERVLGKKVGARLHQNLKRNAVLLKYRHRKCMVEEPDPTL